MQTERRSSYRIALPAHAAFVEDSASRRRASLRSLNAAGGAIAFDRNDEGAASQHVALHFHLGTHSTFLADVALLGPGASVEGEPVHAFRFERLAPEALGTLSAFLCATHAAHSGRLDRLFSSHDHTLELRASDPPATRSVNGPATILTLLRHYLVDQQVPCYLYDESGQRAIRLSHVDVEPRPDGPCLRAAGDAALAHLDPAREHVCFYSTASAVTWFRTAVTRTAGGGLVIAVPTLLLQGGFRCSRRVAPPWPHPLRATIEAPHHCGARITGPVREVAGNGFSMTFAPTRDRLFPGQPLHHVRIDLPVGAVAMECVLRRCHPAADEPERMVGGFEIVGFHSPADHDRWMRCLIPCLFPGVELGEEQAVALAWQRLERSGYLELISPDEGSRLQAPFFTDWTRHVGHEGFRARFLLSHDQGMPIGLAAANLVYPKTCLVHSGGIDKDAQGGGRVLKLYAASFLFAHSVGDYCLSLFDAQKPINAVLFQRFLHQYTARQDNVFDSFTVYRWQSASALPAGSFPAKPSLAVCSATPDLLRVLWEHQRRTLSPLELDAYGWSVDNAAMHQFSESCARHGYERQRHIFFALADGEPVAALIAETGSEGMNLFSLLNACTIVFLGDVGRHRSAAVQALLARAVDFYNGAGKGAFLFLAFGGVDDDARVPELGFVRVAEGWRWLAAKRVIPAYISYLQDLTVARDDSVRRKRSASDSRQTLLAGGGI